MARSGLYLPLLLRILHNLHGLLILGAIVTGFWVYNTYDGRFGKLPLPPGNGAIDLHGTIAVGFFFLLPVFALYSFHAGQHRLIQANSLSQSAQIQHSSSRYSQHQIVNTALLLAAVFAAISGRMMQERWLPNGDLNQPWYVVHLIAWVVMVIAVALHLLMVARVGGVALFQAMLSVRSRPDDRPKTWIKQAQNWWQQRSQSSREP
ncbi:cytochrome b/b6 domain-containing protein [Pantanalinema rosaneae CENA516]|uniref:cytochrome b/b6 domain-containing protein n=1 Tax=Pantanalinema rosaneae TaxID=1620701 RepID=UPI003D6FD622